MSIPHTSGLGRPQAIVLGLAALTVAHPNIHPAQRRKRPWAIGLFLLDHEQVLLTDLT